MKLKLKIKLKLKRVRPRPLLRLRLRQNQINLIRSAMLKPSELTKLRLIVQGLLVPESHQALSQQVSYSVAVIRHNDGRDEIVSPEVAAEVWLILNNEVEPTEEQDGYCSTINRVFLNWRNAPDTYIQRHMSEVRKKVIQEWMRNLDGDYMRPEPTDIENIEFCKKWRLYDTSRSTEAIATSNAINTHYASK